MRLITCWQVFGLPSSSVCETSNPRRIRKAVAFHHSASQYKARPTLAEDQEGYIAPNYEVNTMKDKQQQKPVSTQKLAANRNNATSPTGPRTTVGKQRASQNSYQHGFYRNAVWMNLHCATIQRAAIKDPGDSRGCENYGTNPA